MLNAAISFIAGLGLLALGIDLAGRSFSNVVLVGVFFLALFVLVPLTLVQLYDDAFLARRIWSSRKRGE